MHYSRSLFILISIGIIVRLLIWLSAGFDRDIILTGDGKEFDALAFHIVHYGTFTSGSPDIPDIRRTPVYPLWIAFIRWITGHHYHPAWVTLTHSLFYGLTVILIYRLMTQAFNHKTALIAAGLFSLDLSGIGNGILLMAESLYAMFLMLSVVGFYLFLRHTQYRYALFSGLCYGLMTLTKPMGFYFIPLLLPVVLISLWLKKSQRKIYLAGYSALVLGFAVIVVPWIMRNYANTGVMQVSSIQDYQLVYYQAAIVRAKAEKITREEAVEKIRQEIRQSSGEIIDGRENAGQLAVYRAKAWEIIQQYPTIAAVAFVTGRIIQLLDPDRFTFATILYGKPGEGYFNRSGESGGLTEIIKTLLRQKKLLMILLMNFLILFFVTMALIVTIFRTQFPDQARALIFILLMLFVFHWCVTGLTPWARFRVMFFPLIAMLAAPGIMEIGRYVKKVIHQKFRAD